MDIFDEQTLELTLKASNEGIWDWDLASNKIFYSDRILEFLGRDASSTPNIMTHAEELVHEDDVDNLNAEIARILGDTSDELLKIDCRILKPDGEVRWLRMRGIVTRDQNTATRVTGSMIDISKRKFAEEMIIEEQHMLRLIIDSIPLQVYFKDTNSCYKLVNQRQVEWLGKEKESEIINHCSSEFFSTESWKVQRREELDIMLTGRPVINAIQVEQWPHKEDTYVKKVKHPWYDSANQLLGTYGISCDVTSLIQAKKKLEKIAIDLQKQNLSNQEELLLAKEIQHAILPHNAPHWDQFCKTWEDKVTVETLYQPAAELAGDFYDIVCFTDNTLGFLVIDITGHGVRTAMIISLIKGLMERAEHLSSQPAKYLEEINTGLAAIYQKESINLYASASYTFLDFNDQTITISKAGNSCPMLRIKATSQLRPLSREIKESDLEPALGALLSTHYKEYTYPIEEVESILLFTDGIYEATNKADKPWGIESLTDTYEKSYSQSNIPSLDYLLNAAAQWSELDHLRDDICMVNIDFKPLHS